MKEEFLNGKVTLLCGDCLDILPSLSENSIDSVCCDPPYHLTNNIGTRSPLPGQYTPIGQPKAPKGGFMGKQWDGGDIAFRPEVWREVFRMLKPGAYIVAFSSSRTYHHMAVAIESVGFITHPLIGWVTGQGFPKAHSVSKHIDRMAGVEREIVGKSARHVSGKPEQKTAGLCDSSTFAETIGMGAFVTAPATDAARQWEGWFYGTQSLKPALEPIYVGQKPFEKGLNGTQNILKWGTGAINVDGCRVEVSPDDKNHAPPSVPYKNGIALPTGNSKGRPVENLRAIGRWPANLIHDGSEEVLAGLPETQSGDLKPYREQHQNRSSYGFDRDKTFERNGDSGSAARFFYTNKADSDDRLGSKHPTVKPLDLIQYLVRLVTPPKGLCLDLFAGTGTTGEAAFRDGMRAVLIEREAEYQDDIRRRMALVLSGPDERAREAIKARMKDKPRDDGPLFGGTSDWDSMWSRPFDYPERI